MERSGSRQGIASSTTLAAAGRMTAPSAYAAGCCCERGPAGGNTAASDAAGTHELATEAEAGGDKSSSSSSELSSSSSDLSSSSDEEGDHHGPAHTGGQSVGNGEAGSVVASASRMCGGVTSSAAASAVDSAIRELHWHATIPADGADEQRCYTRTSSDDDSSERSTSSGEDDTARITEQHVVALAARDPAQKTTGDAVQHTAAASSRKRPVPLNRPPSMPSSMHRQLSTAGRPVAPVFPSAPAAPAARLAQFSRARSPSPSPSCNPGPERSVLKAATPLLTQLLASSSSSFHRVKYGRASAASGAPPPLASLPTVFDDIGQYTRLFRECLASEVLAAISDDLERGGRASERRAAHPLVLRIESEVGEGLVDAHITSAGNGSSERGVVELDVESTVFLTLHGHHLPANIGELPRGCLGLVTRAGAASACVRLHQAAARSALGQAVELRVYARRLSSLKGALRSYAALMMLEATGPFRSWAECCLLQPRPPPTARRPALGVQPPLEQQPMGVACDGALTAIGEVPLSAWSAPFRAAIGSQFNSSQQAAIWACVLARTGVKLLAGPPGTGKTTTVRGVISALLALRPSGMSPVAHPPTAPARISKPQIGSTTLPSLTPSVSVRGSGNAAGGVRRRRLLVCAPSNAGVDEVVVRLLTDGLIDGTTGGLRPVHGHSVHAHAPLLRLGDSDRMAPRSRLVTLDTLTSARLDLTAAEAAACGRQTGTGYTREQTKGLLLAGAEIVCTTLAGAGMEILRGGGGSGQGSSSSFDAIVVDEATQAAEPELLVALQHCAPLVILVGDEMQLPPTVVGEAARQAGYGVSMFERLVRGGHPKALLTVQYRMHPAISALPSSLFYGGQLVDAVRHADRPTPAGLPWPDPCSPVLVIDVAAGCEHSATERKREAKRQKLLDGSASELVDAPLDRTMALEANPKSGSMQNLAEAKIVLRVVQMLLSGEDPTAAATSAHVGPSATPPPREGITAADVGIISPYAQQVTLIKSLLNDSCSRSGSGSSSSHRSSHLSTANIEVSTVDGFQGREKEIIVVSTVRAQLGNGPYDIGFLRDGRRMNVALTRARRGLVIVCNARTLGTPRCISARKAKCAEASRRTAGGYDGADGWVRLLENARTRGLLLNATALEQ